MSSKNGHVGFIQKVATFIVDQRNLFFLFYIAALVFCLFSKGWVDVENDITTYLPEDTETRQGIEVMNDNFTTFGSARVMVSNITFETAQELCDAISDVDGVQMVSFDGTPDHYQDASALFEINFSGESKDPATEEAMRTIYDKLDGYDITVDTAIGINEINELDKEMTQILIVAVIIIILVLTLTSRSYAEVPVLIITFGMAAILNMGTNFMCGKISFISNSVAVVLQLALAIDYAIILCHRFSDEHETKNARDACIIALTKSIPEISASSLTTISGLVALSFMKFSIGLDLSIVLIKSIFLSMLSVFTLMPGLLVLMSPLIDKTKHRKLLPNITLVGKFAVKTRKVMPALFAVLLVAAFILSNQCPYCYGYNEVETTKMSDMQIAQKKIKDTFGSHNMVAIVVPSGDYEAEKAVMKELEAKPEVQSTLALSSMEALDGYTLTDALNPREFSELIDLDYEVAQALYTAYAVDGNQYGQIINGMSEYKVPLFDMFLFLKDQLQDHNIVLEEESQQVMDQMFAMLEAAQQQMQNENYSRMVVFLNLPEEGEKTFSFLDEIHRVLAKHYDGDYYVVGNSTSCRDLAASFSNDNLMISILSALFVIIVLLFTFKSIALPLLLIIVIQGSIWINFSFPTLMNQPLYFLGYLIVNAIQMGANIDYAIVISSHYQELKTRMPHKKAIIDALNSSFPTVFTSGGIMASAGLLIGGMSAQPVIAIMGHCLGRGTIISVILVLGILPSILVLGDSIIEHTRFKIKGIDRNIIDTAGTMKVKGHVRGYISGMVDANFSGVIRGDMNATVSSDTQITHEEDEEKKEEKDNA